MTDKILGNNQVNVYGEVVSTFSYSHEVYGEGFYMLQLSVKRLSKVYDIIPLMISERLIDVTKDYRGCYLEASGQFRSYNRHEENRNRLVLSVFVRDVHIDDVDQKNRTTFSWMDTFANHLYTERHRWDERLRICFWQLTGHMASLIIFHVSAGGEMPAMQMAFQ